MPSKGRSRKPNATDPVWPRVKEFPLLAVCVLAVWILRLTEVAAEPAAMVAGEKVAVAPTGKPVAENPIASTKV